MQPLSSWQTALMLVGGLLMAVGAGCCAFLWQAKIFSWVFLVGAVAFVSMQWQQRYEGDNLTIRRLRRIMILSDVCFLLAAVLMFANMGNVFGLSQITYVEYIYNKWVIALLIAAVLQLYSTHRISHELEKEAKKL